MAKTAVINPRGRDGRFKKGGRRKRRKNPSRRDYGAAARSSNPPRRRRRRRYYGGARRRRRNPASPYATSGYYRRPNPSGFDFNELTDTLPAATAGVLAARFAVKQSGAWEAAQDGTLEPGIKQAIAAWIGAIFGGQIVGQVLGSEAKGNVAKIAALGYAGDLFLRQRFMRDSEFVQKNFSLQGMGDDEDGELVIDEDGNVYQLNGFEASSPIGAVGETFVDAVGNRYQSTAQGWQLLGAGGVGAVPYYGDPVSGFESSSPLGMEPARPNSDSSFGYSR